MKLTFAFFTLFLLGACASTTVTDKGISVMNQAAYENVVDGHTDRLEMYNGLANTVTAQATVLNTDMCFAELEQSARLYEWDQSKMENERKNTIDRLRDETDVFVSFYTPERKWDDLAKNKTLWKIFLDVDGRRYEGKAEKIKLLTREVQSLYPYHSRFATPYLLKFPVSTTAIDGHSVRVTITGSVDTVVLNLR